MGATKGRKHERDRETPITLMMWETNAPPDHPALVGGVVGNIEFAFLGQGNSNGGSLAAKSANKKGIEMQPICEGSPLNIRED